MVDRDVATNKLDAIQRSLARVREKFVSKDLFLSDRDIQELILFNLHQAIQSAMDLASHIIADEGLGVPRSGRELFQILATNGIISPELSLRLSVMAGFRNILVHEYIKLDLEQVASILEQDLDDLDLYCRHIAKLVK